MYVNNNERTKAMNLGKSKKPSRILTFNDNCITLSEGQTKVLNIFFYTMLAATVTTMIGIILFYVYSLAALYHDRTTETSLWLLSIFSDFVEIMNFSLDDSPYLDGVGSSYPPVAIMVLYPFALICKSVFSQYASYEHLDVDELTSLVVRHPQFWVALLLFFFTCILSIIFLVTRKYRLDLKATLKMAIVISFSAPFIYAIMRGNTIYFALIFLLLFLFFYNSKSPLLRELALISLAIAGTIKIYPLFFGVFLLNKKKIFASFRVAIYFALIFFISFKFFPGNSGDVDPFVENLQGFMSDAERLSCFRNLSLTALLYKIVHLFSASATESSAFEIANIVILALVFVIATVTATVTRSNLSRAVICASVIILIPSVSYFYVLIFEIIPFMEYLMEYDSLSKRNRIIYGVLFMFLMFTPILLPQFFIPHALIVIFMAACEVYKVTGKEIIPWFKNRKKIKKI